MHLNKENIANLDRKFRLNLINSIGGIKPGNLIGTKSSSGETNLAIFFSVMHLQSDPPLLGFMLRPFEEIRRDTWENINETGYFTVNLITQDMAERAHCTSAKFDSELSEFDECQFKPIYLNNFIPPYVEESPLKIGVRYLDSHYIASSKTTLVVGEIEQIFIPEKCLNSKWYIDFEKIKTVGIGGLNTYYKIKKFAEFPYARVGNLPKFN